MGATGESGLCCQRTITRSSTTITSPLALPLKPLLKRRSARRPLPRPPHPTLRVRDVAARQGRAHQKFVHELLSAPTRLSSPRRASLLAQPLKRLYGKIPLCQQLLEIPSREGLGEAITLNQLAPQVLQCSAATGCRRCLRAGSRTCGPENLPKRI